MKRLNCYVHGSESCNIQTLVYPLKLLKPIRIISNVLSQIVPYKNYMFPKKQAIECVALSGDCSFIGEERMQVENVNNEATDVKGEKKHRTMDNEQGVVSTMGLAEVARQPCRA